MLSFLSKPGQNRNDVPAEPVPVAKAAVHPLDELTGGAFSAPTSGERAAKVRAWLATDPAVDSMAEVFKELSHRDKGAAKALKEVCIAATSG